MGTPWADQLFKFLSSLRYRATLPVAAADGATVEALGDKYGRIVTVAPQPSGRYVVPATTYKGRVVAVGAQLFALHGFNHGASDRWIHLFDQSALVAPADGSTPFERISVPAGQSFGYEPGHPVAFANGIFWAVSSTASLLTIDAAATCHVSATYGS